MELRDRALLTSSITYASTLGLFVGFSTPVEKTVEIERSLHPDPAYVLILSRFLAGRNQKEQENKGLAGSLGREKPIRQGLPGGESGLRPYFMGIE